MININVLFRWLAMAGLVISIFAISILLSTTVAESVKNLNFAIPCFLALISLFLNLVAAINTSHKVIILTMAINLSFSFVLVIKLSSYYPEGISNINTVFFIFNGITLFLVVVKYFFERTAELIKLSQENISLNKSE